MANFTFLRSDGQLAQYDLDAGTYAICDPSGAATTAPRPITDEERRSVDPNYLNEQVASLTAALDQLILDALMGGM